ncbi:MAG: single-stranded DNA-binding protein [Synechococcaceae bacterium WB4_1_0192]|nr:single-stranded DNA-binding protein [Synechococcaceae bacterium WB4_1_0192]
MAFIGQITGNLGRDPELKYLENGQIVANFTVAVRQPKRQGQDQPARWVKVAVWGKSAEYVGNYVKKGDKVFLMGRVEEPEQYTDRNGQLRQAERFTAENIEKFGDAQGQAAPAQAAPAPAAAAPAPAPHQAAAGWQPNPQQGTVAAGWNSAPLAPPDDDGIPF